MAVVPWNMVNPLTHRFSDYGGGVLKHGITLYHTPFLGVWQWCPEQSSTVSHTPLFKCVAAVSRTIVIVNTLTTRCSFRGGGGVGDDLNMKNPLTPGYFSG